MKILLVGSNFSYAIERYFVRYLTEMGATIEHFAAQDMVLEFCSKNIVNKILFHSKIYTGYAGVNKKLLETAEAFNPDIVWVFKGMEIFPKTIQQLNIKGIKTVNFNGDHPFIFSGRGSGNKNVTESFPLYDAHFTYMDSLKKAIENNYHIQSFLLPFGYELSDSLYETCNFKETKPYACFIGNPDEIRVSFIRELISAKIPIDLYGHGWNKYIEMNELCTINEPVYGEAFWKTVRQYRIQLNIFRKHNEGSHNMRSFEIPAVGGLQLAPDTEEHRSFFEDQKEIFLYRDIPDCIELIKSIVVMDDTAIDTIRVNARERSIKSGYSYQKRAGQAFTYFQSIL